jgi:hypothetical protein
MSTTVEKQKRIGIPTEHEEQARLIAWTEFMEHLYPELRWIYAVPNGGLRPYKEYHDNHGRKKRYSTESNKLKAEGVKAGVPDLCLPIRKSIYTDLYIEMKRISGGKLSDDQEAWLNHLLSQGKCAVICKGCEAAQQVILHYLNLENGESLPQSYERIPEYDLFYSPAMATPRSPPLQIVFPQSPRASADHHWTVEAPGHGPDPQHPL